jgi:hypothetical protein
MKAAFKKSEGNKLIAIIGDEVLFDSCRTQSPASFSPASENATSRGETNYLVVD